METNLFNLNIDPVTKSHLSETAKWARFLAIIGMVFLFLSVITAIFGTSAMFSSMQNIEMEDGGMSRMMPVVFSVYMIIITVISFFPLLYTLRFANGMRAALRSNDQDLLNRSFQNLKICFRYLGIVAIIFLAITAIILVISILTFTIAGAR